jgi:hypothetical protein
MKKRQERILRRAMTPEEYHASELMESLEKLRDFNINMVPTPELAKYYQTWIDQVKAKNVTDSKLKTYLHNQINYWIAKDRNYAKYLGSFIGETV